MAAFNELPPAHLMRLIGTPQCPIIIDVCIDDDFACDPYLIPSAVRFAHTDIDAILAHVGTRACVVVCQKGLKLSHGMAAILRANGIDAQVLAGGNQAWRDTHLPRIPAAIIPGPRWVTRHRPKIDRIACPWLIRRFVDPNAQFMFVPTTQVTAVAEKLNATPFDIPDTFWGHRDTGCTFDTMISEFGLTHPALLTMANVIRAADTNQHGQSPQAAGLLAISVGLSRMHRDDNAQLDAGMVLYDALYRWARDGQEETHDQ